MNSLERCREDKERAYLLVDDITSVLDCVQPSSTSPSFSVLPPLAAICQIQDLIEEWALEADLDQPLGEENT